MKHKYVILSSLLACILLFFIEQVIPVNYFIKTLTKIVLFIGIPIYYIKKLNKITIKEALNLSKPSFKQFKMGIILGLLSFTVVLITFVLLKDHINLDDIINDLQTKSKITPANFIFIGLYITFFNALLEEFFFRGFIFLNLVQKAPKTAYIYSSLLFGVYHIGIFFSWFNFYLVLLALFGLILIAFIFNYIDTKSKNFINSYIVHILADIAIILIGMRLFEII